MPNPKVNKVLIIILLLLAPSILAYEANGFLLEGDAENGWTLEYPTGEVYNFNWINGRLKTMGENTCYWYDGNKITPCNTITITITPCSPDLGNCDLSDTP